MKYEYCQIYKGEQMSDIDWLEQINNFGQEGWELVAIVPETEFNTEKAYFKKVIK